MLNRLLGFLAALVVFATLAAPALAQSDAAAQPQEASGEAAQNPRIALVIGNSAYADATLATPANDAALVAQTLQAAGFDVVGARDLDEKALRGALKDFVAKAASIGPAMQAFVYFSGRAVQYEGENFLVPVDAQIAHASDVPIEAVRVADYTHALAAAPGEARVVVLDGARANPYAKGDAPLAPGLALVDPDAGSLVAFNASPDAAAPDETGAYGVYGKTLAGAMREGGLAIDEALVQTRVAVNAATKGAQIPWFASKLAQPYYVFERAADAPPPQAAAAITEAETKPIKSYPADQAYAAAVQRDTMPAYQEYLSAYPDGAQARRVRAILAARREALFWRRSVAADTPRGYWTYLRAYPRGPHAPDARRRLAILSARDAPPPDFAPVVYEDLPPPPPDEVVYVERPYWAYVDDFGPPPPPPPAYFVPAFEPDWINLPRPAPAIAYGVLPTLAVTIPLLLTARAYRDAGRRRGFAPPYAPRILPPPQVPPRLPPNIKIKPPPGISGKPPAFGKPAPLAKPLPPLPKASTTPTKPPALNVQPFAPGTPGGVAKPLAPPPKALTKETKPSVLNKPPLAPQSPAAVLPKGVKPANEVKPAPLKPIGLKPVVPTGPQGAKPAFEAKPKLEMKRPPLEAKPPPKLAKPPAPPKPALQFRPAAPAKPAAQSKPLCGKPGLPRCP